MELRAWWETLEEQWQQAFRVTFFQAGGSPDDAGLQQLAQAKVLRFAGPAATFPNMPFALTNLTGVTKLTNLEILVATHHEIETVVPLQRLTKLKSLFLFDNKIKSLKGLEGLLKLEQLYVQQNQVTTLEPLKKLTALKELYIVKNQVANFDGLGAGHADALEKFYCLPNDRLKQKEVIKMERKLGIRCLNG